jgi:hypothetical protein
MRRPTAVDLRQPALQSGVLALQEIKLAGGDDFLGVVAVIQHVAGVVLGVVGAGERVNDGVADIGERHGPASYKLRELAPQQPNRHITDWFPWSRWAVAS